MSKWADAWNELPPEIRKIGAMCQTEMRIQQLKAEKARLLKRYRQSVKEVDDHIASLRRWLEYAESEE